MSQIQRIANHCDKCGHDWLPTVADPKHCPKCKSRLWNGSTKKIIHAVIKTVVIMAFLGISWVGVTCPAQQLNELQKDEIAAKAIAINPYIPKNCPAGIVYTVPQARKMLHEMNAMIAENNELRSTNDALRKQNEAFRAQLLRNLEAMVSLNQMLQKAVSK